MSAWIRPSFGIKTVPVRATYDDILAVWREADAIPRIEHAWLWDHMLPLFGDPSTPILEGWTLLAALAGQTERLRIGLMVTSNRIRPPAVLAKIAATVDLISGGRLEFGIGVGATDSPGRPGQELATREYDAYGIDLVSPADGIGALDEACTLVRRLWTEGPFDFDGRYYHLAGARCEPKPVQQPHPPILIGGWGRKTLRVVAGQADIWNVPGPPHNTIDFIRKRSRILDEHCAEIARNPRDITRSAQIVISYDNPAAARATLLDLVDAGVSHLVIGLPAPFPPHVARWVAAEIIGPVSDQAANVRHC